MSTGEESLKQEDLQAQIYAVHEGLRKKFKGFQQEQGRDEENWQNAWAAHTGNKKLLADYANAMHRLATKIWAPRNTDSSSDSDTSTDKVKCRIEWVMIKIRQHFSQTLNQRTKLKLLDVGSCYNPFSVHSDLLDIVPVDLCPAKDFRHVIFQSDFLNVDIAQEGLTDGLTFHQNGDGSKQLEQLSLNYFDVVVFSFFLEYLPSTNQRFESCQRAYKVLRPGGMLFILRPDSNSVTPARMKFIKQLKVGLAFTGFKRLYCDKLQHLWAMGFLKLDEQERSSYLTSRKFEFETKRVDYSLNSLDKLFAIPQDSKQFDETSSPAHSTTNRDAASTLLFDELPGYDS